MNKGIRNMLVLVGVLRCGYHSLLFSSLDVTLPTQINIVLMIQKGRCKS